MTVTMIQQTLELAEQHRLAGRLEEADRLCQDVLREHPDQVETLNLSGVLAFQRGDHQAAVDAFRRGIAISPSAAQMHRNLGMVFASAGRLDEAVAAFRKSVSLRPNSVETWNSLGDALVSQRKWEEATEAFQNALVLNPASAEIHNNLGFALLEKKQTELAVASFRRALELQPKFAFAFCNLGNALAAQHQNQEAVNSYHQAIALQPDFFEAWHQLANLLNAMEDFDAAMAAYQKVLSFKPEFAAAHNNIGNILHLRGDLDGAIGSYRRALAQEPDFPFAHWNLALVLLLQGQFKEGWENYEWRTQVEEFLPAIRKYDRPVWDGSDLKGRMILLHAEQALGDTIHFARYVPLIQKRGGKIILQCQKTLQRLFVTLDGPSEIISFEDALPAFDVHCPLPGLPHVLGMDLPYWDHPYLKSDPALGNKFKDFLHRAEGKLKVGLVWAGRARPTGRSVPLGMLGALAHPKIQFFSLQVGEGSEDVKSAPAGLNLIDITNQIGDFADTAALMAGLDLIISIDTAAAQLAGALGKKCWTLLKMIPDWRWLLDRNDSPWYPSMKLFRQTKMGDWSDPIARMGDELKTFVEG